MTPKQIAASLTRAERTAIRDSFVASWGMVYVPGETRWDVRRRLVAKGLASKRIGMPLRKAGLSVREILRSRTNGDDV